MALRKRQETVREFEVVRRTTCGNCPTGCGLKVYVRDGKVVDLFGDEEHPVNKGSLCPKGLLSLFHLENPSRLIRPLVREDLSEAFHEADWEEAMAFAARKLSGLLAERGADSLVIHGKETDPFDYLAGGARFAALVGTPHTPGTFFPLPFGPDGAVRNMFGIPASQLQGNVPRDWCNSRCIVLYGCDPAASDPIAFGPVLDARDRGTTVIAIDSRRSVTSSKATLAVRVKPGTGSIFLRGLLRLLIEREAVDTGFIDECTEGFEGFTASLAAETPEAVSKACWTDPADLERAADLIAKLRPVQVIAGSWASRGTFADDDLLACAALATATGSIGIPGGGVNFLGVSPFDFGATPGASLETALADPTRKSASVVFRGDPCSTFAGGATPLVELGKLPLVVQLASYVNETSRYAHVVFPESFWLESTGLLAMNNGRALQRHNRVVEPPGECRSPFEFWSDFARAMGYSEFPHGNGSGARSGRDTPPGAFYDACLRENPLTRSVTFADLDPEDGAPGGVLWPCTEPAHLDLETTRYIRGTTRGVNILFQRNHGYPGSTARFPTPAGKIVFQPFAARNGDGTERGCGPETAARPLLLITGTLVDRVEPFGASVSDRNPAPAEMILIHPKLARALEVENGDALTVEGDFGWFSAPAFLSDDVDPRVLWFPSGAGKGEKRPDRLFPPAAPGRPPCGAARIMVHKAGSDREVARRAVERMAAALG